MGPSIDPWETPEIYIQGISNYISKVTLSTIYSDTLLPVFQIWVVWVLLKPYTSTLATRKSWGIQIKALDKPVKTAPTTLLLSNLFL